jgi:hypothetical protein
METVGCIYEKTLLTIGRLTAAPAIAIVKKYRKTYLPQMGSEMLNNPRK